MPETTSPISIELAGADLWYGYRNLEASVINKLGSRWGANPSVRLLDDFNQLMVYLFSEYSQVTSDYFKKAQASKRKPRIPPTKLGTLQKIWERTLPQRQLQIGSGAVRVTVPDGSGDSYPGSQMSDGERVVFYLIGQALAAPESAFLIIDEPEIHLHRSIQARLWDEIEAARPDCLFIYMTHDLSFAASRTSATKIWLKSYDSSGWDWSLVPTDTGFPDELLLELLGSRRPILFVEGERDGLDHRIYRHLYPDHSVHPVGSCGNVIHCTRSFQAVHDLHENECRGIIDRDQRDDREVSYLASRGVHALAFSTIEALLLAEPVLERVAKHLLKEDPKATVESVKNLVFETLRESREEAVLKRVRWRIDRKLKKVDANAKSRKALKEGLDMAFRGLKVDGMARTASKRIGTILRQKNYEAALKTLQQKGLLHKAARLFNMDYDGYLTLVAGGIAEGGDWPGLRKEMRKLAPKIKVKG